MGLAVLAGFLHLVGAALWVGGSAALSWAWLPLLRTTTQGLQLLGRAIPSLQWIFRIATFLLLISGGYRALTVGSELPLDKLIALFVMISLWLVLTGLYEMIFARARRGLAALQADATGKTPEFTAVLTKLERLSALTLWLGLLLLLDGAYLVSG
jgi:uncharacterized membrane protein